MIKIDRKEDCCGCGSCYNACPKQCIEMRYDDEGFLYPEIDINNCIECGVCEKVCPIIHVEKDEMFLQDAYIVQNKDDKIRKESTSGGAFTAIAESVIRHGGIVYGAAYDSDFNVNHVSAENVDELLKFRNSKYVQSDTKRTFSEVESYLKSNRMVCYSGTPCQIEGLKRYLKKDYEKLVTVDVVCHAVPSPLVWRKYLDMQNDKYGKTFSNILFRDKYYGYKYSTMTIKDSDGKNIYNYGIDTDPMLRAFFSNICDRPSCYKCVFKKRYRVSDFTIWDCYTVSKFDKKLDDDKGTTRLLIHTDKGRHLFEKMKCDLNYTKVSANELTDGVKEMFESVDYNENREKFFIDANNKSGYELFRCYFPETIKVKAERTIRIFCYKTGIYSIAKNVFKKVMKR